MPWNPADGTRPVVVVIRHPERETDVRTYAGSGEPLVINLDLGAAFDVSLGDYGDLNEVRDWLEIREHDLGRLPEGHPAREDVEAVMEEVRDVYGLDDEDN